MPRTIATVTAGRNQKVLKPRPTQNLSMASNHLCFRALLVALVGFTSAFLPHRNIVRNLVQHRSTLSSNDVFYPTPALSHDGLTEEEVLYDLFLRQFVGDDVETKPFYESDGGGRLGDSSVSNRNKIIERIMEVPVPILIDTPLEIVYKNRVAFANFVSRKVGKTGLPSSSLLVRLVSGEIVSIDVGQIVSIWDQLADEGVPVTPIDWAQVTGDALEILGNMSPRKSDLQEFWQLVSKQRSSSISVDSLDLGVYIFQERSFRKWVNPYAEAAESNVRALSAAQRYAAALLLYNDDFHFKRKQSVVGSVEEEAEEEEEVEEVDEEVETAHQKVGGVESSARSVREKALTGYSVEDIMNDRRQSAAARNVKSNAEVPALYVIEGAYRILDEGISMFREGEVFATYFESRKAELLEQKSPGSSEVQKVSPFRAGCITRQLRALEIYAMSPSSVSPPPAVKHILKRLTRASNPEGAKAVLKEMNYNPNSSVAAAAVSAMRLKRGARFGVTDAERDAETSTGSTNNFYSSVTPWTEEMFDAAVALSEEVDRRRKENDDLRSGPAGKKGPSGRMDYRSNSAEHPVMCVDGKKASFLDDAFSISPDTGEVLVHVVDVVGTLRRHELLQQTARDRISSTFLPSGPIHMLPPQALDSLKLCTHGPNEVITVALSVDSISGVVLGFRIFPSLIGPVFTMDVETADEIIAGVGIKKGSIQGQEVSDRPGFPDAVVRDLLTVRRLMDKVVEKQPWVDVHFGAANPRQFKLNKKTDTYQQSSTEKTPANRMVNSLLTMYSNSSCLFCASKGVDVPIAWENRDRVDSAMVRRFGTQPLRNWLSQLQQKQLRAALNMELPLSRKECAMAVTHHNNKRKQVSGLVMQGRDLMSFESFESHCASVFAGSEGSLIFNAEGTGRGGIVRIKEFRVDGVVPVTVERGEMIRVKVKKIIPETKTIVLEHLQ